LVNLSITDTEFRFSELTTLIIGLVTLFIGIRVRDHIPWLKRIALPDAVVGAVLVALVTLLADLVFAIKVAFGSELRNLLLLVFFATIGLSAKLRALVAGGRPLLILRGVTVLLIIAQNVAGVAVALTWGAHPFYGLLVGGLSFVGGPGTALAWAKEAEAQGLLAAQPVGIGAATLAVVTGALLSGPITGFLIQRHRLRPSTEATPEIAFAEAPIAVPSLRNSESGSLAKILSLVLLIAIAVYLGEELNLWAREKGLMLPGFLSAMIAGIVITNVAAAVGWHIELRPIELGDEVALNLFLVVSLMSTPLIAVATIVAPLALNVAIQILVIVVIAYFVLFPLLGRDYDAAITVGGFVGFGLASMPVAMATMDEIARRHGPSPKAFLLITLAGSFFVDLANAGIAKLFLLLPMFRFG
jgi:ESS family glutamate:Na+ symporter